MAVQRDDRIWLWAANLGSALALLLLGHLLGEVGELRENKCTKAECQRLDANKPPPWLTQRIDELRARVKDLEREH